MMFWKGFWKFAALGVGAWLVGVTLWLVFCLTILKWIVEALL